MASKENGGGGKKTLLIIAAVLGVLLLVCCGVGTYFVGSFGKKLAEAMTTDPAKIREIQTSIADISIPESYVPQMGMNMDLGGNGMKMAMYVSNGQAGQLMLMQMQQPGMSPEAAKAQFQAQAQQQGQGGIIEESRTVRTFRINGEDCEFAFITGTNANTNQPAMQVIGAFPSKGGTGVLMVMEQAENWDEAAVIEMLESLGPEVTSADSGSDDTTTEAPMQEDAGPAELIPTGPEPSEPPPQ